MTPFVRPAELVNKFVDGATQPLSVGTSTFTNRLAAPPGKLQKVCFHNPPYDRESQEGKGKNPLTCVYVHSTPPHNVHYFEARQI